MNSHSWRGGLPRDGRSADCGLFVRDHSHSATRRRLRLRKRVGSAAHESGTPEERRRLPSLTPEPVEDRAGANPRTKSMRISGLWLAFCVAPRLSGVSRPGARQHSFPVARRAYRSEELAFVFTVDRAVRETRRRRARSTGPFLIIPPDLAARTPGSGGWSVAANVAHLVLYEERIAIPLLEAAAHGEDGAGSVPSGDEGCWPVVRRCSQRSRSPRLLRAIEPLPRGTRSSSRRLMTRPSMSRAVHFGLKSWTARWCPRAG